VAKAGTTDAHSDFEGDEAAAAQWLGSRVDLYARSAQARQPDKSKVPYPASWFNAGRYDDDEAEWNHVGLQELREERRSAEARVGSREAFVASAPLCWRCQGEIPEERRNLPDPEERIHCSQECMEESARILDKSKSSRRSRVKVGAAGN